jgi:hypothetical protein
MLQGPFDADLRPGKEKRCWICDVNMAMLWSV